MGGAVVEQIVEGVFGGGRHVCCNLSDCYDVGIVGLRDSGERRYGRCVTREDRLGSFATVEIAGTSVRPKKRCERCVVARVKAEKSSAMRSSATRAKSNKSGRESGSEGRARVDLMAEAA